MNAIVEYLSIQHFVSFVFILCAYCFNSCDKYEYDIYIDDNRLLKFKSKFKEDSATFYKSFDRTNYNFRQSLTRIIHWDKVKVKKRY